MSPSQKNTLSCIATFGGIGIAIIGGAVAYGVTTNRVNETDMLAKSNTTRIMVLEVRESARQSDIDWIKMTLKEIRDQLKTTQGNRP